MIGARATVGTTFVVAAMLGSSACATAPSPGDRPAVLVEPTAESRAELARTLREALHGAPITIADDALTRDSTLIVERAPARTAAGMPLSGRQTGRPEHFRLVTNGVRCVLVQERTSRRWTLKAATCSPVSELRPRRSSKRSPSARGQDRLLVQRLEARAL